jgi:nucleotide-binding universal stress UspA family protein
MKTFNHIVVPTDFSATARDALRMACAIATGSPAKISLIHVIRDVWREPCVQRDLEQEAWARLRALVAEEQFGGVPVQPVLMFGAAHAEVGRYVEDNAADLMVVGSHGHGLVRRFLLGSVADRLIHTAPCPALVVPHESLRAKPAVSEAMPAAVGVSGETVREPVDAQC